MIQQTVPWSYKIWITKAVPAVGSHHDEIESSGVSADGKKLDRSKTLTGRKKGVKGNSQIIALQVKLAYVDGEIKKLLGSLMGANNVLLFYVNVKIDELDGREQELLAKIAEWTEEAISSKQVSQISDCLETWNSIFFDDKWRVGDLPITTIAATSDGLNITWKI